MSIQESLKMMRLELGLTQNDLAQKTGKAFVTVNRWENGRGIPSRSVSKKIIEIASQCGASKECISYLEETLLPEVKRKKNAAKYGFPRIDQDFLFSIADNSPNAAYVIDSETFEILYANRTAEKMAKYDMEKTGTDFEERKLETIRDKRCFNFFGNRKEQCPFCPLKHMGDNGLCSGSVTSPQSGRKYNVNARRTTYHNKDVTVIYLSYDLDLKPLLVGE